MQVSTNRQAINTYGREATSSEVNYASPHRLIQMLMEGALGKIAFARGNIERNELAAKGKNISWASSIVDGLRDSLDLEKGGEIAQNLDDLYDYMSRRLIEANSKNDSAILDEVTALLIEVKSGWDAIPESYRK
ncbi:MAG: flagellar protein FliS [Gammaproteobacteria bacterium]|nr:MAG: flagellar protein FliS [Gammaproteobacteria bacterium]RLA19886.1 MAG: flagellar protein FliS [Gammaproteobacteria bacterium]